MLRPVLGLGLLIFGAASSGVAVLLEPLGELAPELSEQLVSDLSKAIEKRSGSRVVIDEASGPCLDPNGCIAAVRSRTAAEEVLWLRLFAGPLSIRIAAERTAAGESTATARIEADLPKSRASWQVPLVEMVGKIVPPARSVMFADNAPVIRSGEPIHRRTLTPWLVMLGGAAAIGLGAVLATASSHAAEQLPKTIDPASFRDLRSQSGTEGDLSSLFYGLGAAGAAAGLVILFAE
jgi:hypothetical protein